MTVHIAKQPTPLVIMNRDWHYFILLSILFIHPAKASIHPVIRSSGHPSIHSSKSSIYSSGHPSIHPSIQVFIRSSIHPSKSSIYSSIHSSIHPSHPSIHPSIYSTGHPIIHPSIQVIHPSIIHSSYYTIDLFVALTYNRNAQSHNTDSQIPGIILKLNIWYCPALQHGHNDNTCMTVMTHDWSYHHDMETFTSHMTVICKIM